MTFAAISTQYDESPSARPLRAVQPTGNAEVLVAGHRERAKAVASLLDDVDARVAHERGAFEVLGNLARECAVAVLVTPLPRLDSETALSLLRVPSSLTRTPVLVVASRDLSDAEARALYERGAYGVYSWPRDGLLLARSVAELVAHEADADCSLDERAFDSALRRRLEAVSALSADVEIEARDGAPILSGRVDARWKKRKLVEFIANAPGVERVDARAIDIGDGARAGIEEREMGVRLRRTLLGLEGVPTGSIAATVKDGTAVVYGTLGFPAQFDAVAQRIAALEGVERVRDATRIDDAESTAASVLARELRQRIERELPGLDLHVCVLGKSVLVTGEVQDAAQRTKVGEIGRSHPRVRRLVDHVEVREAQVAH